VGVLGLVAGKLAEEAGLPAVVATRVGDVLRASCRSGAGLDLAVALESCADLFVRFGGHPGAAGFEVPLDRWDTFRERFLALAAAVPARETRPRLAIDLALRAASVDYALLHELAALAPFGPGSPEPLLAVLGLTVVRVREAAGGHTQLTLRRERDVLDAIAFGRTGLAALLAEGDRVDIVARLASRQFGGYESLQLEVRDLAPSGYHPEAMALLRAGAPDGAPSLPGLVPLEAR
jgi:single-stranded-DNA-specific exonuclease